ncbi:MAG: sugar transferase, partial [Myxococcales bacterium]
MKQAGWRLLVKRAVDVSVGAAALSLSLPVTAAAGVAIRMTMGKPVFFSQLRPGLRGLPFRLYKL